MISTDSYISFQLKWFKNLGSKIDTNISPIISGNTIFTINKDNYLILIDSDNGEINIPKKFIH